MNWILLGFEEIVDLLIQNGANIDAVNEYDDNALHFAANNGNWIYHSKSMEFRHVKLNNFMVFV